MDTRIAMPQIGGTRIWGSVTVRRRSGRVGNRRAISATSFFIAVGLGLVVGFGCGAMVPRPAHGQTTNVVYQPPVPGRIVDDWRPPDRPYGAGNLGIDLFARPGEPVFAAADGVVTFAGNVGNALFVVIAHADGLRTTIGFVQGVFVSVGARVKRGDMVAVAGGPVHFGVRRGSVYLDPRTLFARRVWLVR